jgi:exodeoxyribonuclease VII large subunit
MEFRGIEIMLPKPAPFVEKNMIFSVSDASKLIKTVMETAFTEIRIRGEVSQVTTAASGHIYFTIKDAGAAISAIIWRGVHLPFKIENGMEIVATGKITTYPARSNYQIIVNSVEMAGVGAILKMLEERKRKLAGEGLFDESRKRKLPKYPATIGVVTSPTGAAIHDIINRLSGRMPVRLLVWGATVQGENAAREVVAGIEGLNRLRGVDKPDVIIVARGGGALEDLLPFSEEIVVRAAAASEIPLISGVGHDPDWMLIDFSADVRAPTPTAAAEIAVQDKVQVRADIENLSHRLRTNVLSRVGKLRELIVSRRLQSPKQMIAEKLQRIDDFGRSLLSGFAARLRNLRLGMERFYQLPMLAERKVQFEKQRAGHLGQMLDSLSYKRVLDRGFAIVKSNGRIISDAAAFARPAEIVFRDGKVDV